MSYVLQMTEQQNVGNWEEEMQNHDTADPNANTNPNGDPAKASDDKKSNTQDKSGPGKPQRQTRRTGRKTKTYEEMSADELRTLMKTKDTELNDTLVIVNNQKDKIKTLDKKVKDKTAENTKIKQERDKYETESKKYSKELASLKKEKLKLENELNDDKDKDDKIDELIKESNEKDQKIKDLEDMLHEEQELSAEFLHKSKKQTEKSGDTSERKKVLMFCDANRSVLDKHLENDINVKWCFADNTETVQDLWSKVQNKEYLKKLKKYTGLVIMLGIEDIANGNLGSDVCVTIRRVVDILKKETTCHITICHAAPTCVHMTETALMNSRISDIEASERVQIIKTGQTFTACKMPKTRSNEVDSYLLTEEGAKKCADYLMAQLFLPEMPSISENTSCVSDSDDEKLDDDTENQPIKHIVLEAEKSKIGLVIGRGGSVVRRLQRQTNTRIKQVEWSRDGAHVNGLRIEGEIPGIEKAKLEITKIFKESKPSKNEYDTRKNMSSVMCRYDKAGYCKNGSYCGFIHGSENSRKRSDSVLTPRSGNDKRQKSK